MTDGSPRWLDDRQQTAWRGWIEASTRIGGRIERDLQADSGLTIDDYEVLVRLSEAPNHRLRMADLARQVMSSPSRLSQRIDRMVRSGLVGRTKCEDDKRGWYAVMTEEGSARLTAAAPSHVASVRTHLIEHLSSDEIEFLAELMPRLAGIEGD